MDKQYVADRKGMKDSKPQKTKLPVKIVRISNPLNLTATTSEFKGLVQELTGMDSAGSPHPKYPAAAAEAESAARPPEAGGSTTEK